MKPLLLLCLLPLAGCWETAPVIKTEIVQVAVPVPCTVKVPQRPGMPLDDYQLEDGLDGFVRSALAERVIRNSYEGELVAAAQACAE